MRFLKLATVFLNTCITKVSALFAPSPATPTCALTQKHLKAAELCRDVYSEDIESNENFVKSVDTGAEATVTLEGSQAIVCFRGTDSVADWKSNLNMCKVPFLSRKHKNPELEVHSGFFIGHNSVKDKIYAKLNALVASGECKSILFTGHSAGATLAKLCAFDFVNEKNLELEIISFGSPKLGNAAFAASFEGSRNIRCTRIVNDNDAIAIAPLFSGYRHVGDLIRLRNVAPSEGQTQTLWDALHSFARLDLMADHDIDAYVATIEHSLKKQN